MWSTCEQKGLLVRDDFVRHLYSHVPYRVYRCDKCDNAYAIPSSLRSHFVNWHTGFAPPRYNKATLVQISPSKPDPSMTRPNRSKAGERSGDGGLPSATSQPAMVDHTSSSGEEQDSDGDEEVAMTDQVSTAGNDDVHMAEEASAAESGAVSDKEREVDVISISDDEESNFDDQEDSMGTLLGDNGAKSQTYDNDHTGEESDSANDTNSGSTSGIDGDSDNESNASSDSGPAASSASSRVSNSDSDVDSDSTTDSSSSDGSNCIVSDTPAAATSLVDANMDEDVPEPVDAHLEQYLLSPAARLDRDIAALSAEVQLRAQAAESKKTSYDGLVKAKDNLSMIRYLLSRDGTGPKRASLGQKLMQRQHEVRLQQMSFEKRSKHLEALDSNISKKQQDVDVAQFLVNRLKCAREKEPFPLELLEKNAAGQTVFRHEDTEWNKAINQVKAGRRNGWRCGKEQKTRLTNRRNRLTVAHKRIRAGRLCTVAEAQLLSAQAGHDRVCAAMRDAVGLHAGNAEQCLKDAWSGVLQALHRVNMRQDGESPAMGKLDMGKVLRERLHALSHGGGR
jgi:hypothetical protein